MMRLCLVGLLLVSMACGYGQSVGKRKVQASEDVATQTEVAQAFVRLEGVLTRVVGIELSLTKMPMGDAPAKRAAVIARFHQIFESCRPKFRFMPRPQPFPPEGLGVPTGHPQRLALEQLVRWGLVSSTSPLASGKSDTVTLFELGDSIGYFLLRMADLTHRPHPKFSPMLGGG
jgi:hypothetical protein